MNQSLVLLAPRAVWAIVVPMEFEKFSSSEVNGQLKQETIGREITLKFPVDSSRCTIAAR